MMNKRGDEVVAWVEQAITLLQQGELAAAEAIFRKILKKNPRHADANHLLGVIAIQRGRHDLASG